MCSSDSSPGAEPDSIRFEGGDGSSVAEAVKIAGVTQHVQGVLAEYRYIGQRLGKRGVDWNPVEQSVLFEDDRHYDQIDVALPDGTRRSFFFDISELFGGYP